MSEPTEAGLRNFSPLHNFRHDIPASIAVFLVALPLCLGIALASGAPLASGLIAGIIGGIVVGLLSGSALGVSGPAAGLIVLVISGIDRLGYDVFLLAVVFAGVMQLILGWLRAGVIADYFPSAVISGMLSGIGLIIVLKQIPHAFGYDRDYEGDLDFAQSDGYSTLSELSHMLDFISPAAILITIVSLALLLLWDSRLIKHIPIRSIKMIPASLLAVATGVLINEVLLLIQPQHALQGDHLVIIPMSGGSLGFIDHLIFPDFSQLGNPLVYTTGFIIAIVASLETLLSVDAVDKLDPFKRTTPRNQELLAQGTGNIMSGLLGGLPITQVIVRSSTNVQAQGRTKSSAIIHGILLLLAVLLIPTFINRIPLASLAAVLLTVGFKLAHPNTFIKMYRSGRYHFVPFLATMIGLLLTDLLTGVAIGMSIALFSILSENYRMGVYFNKKKSENKTVIHLAQHVSFLSKANLIELLRKQPAHSELIIDAIGTQFIDYDVREVLENFRVEAHKRKIQYHFIDIPKANQVKSSAVQQQLTPAQALQLLQEGNQRFVNNLHANHDLLSQVNITSEGQYPFAIVLSCIDSRTSSELIFDQGLGDVFSTRIAGNVVNRDIIGSMEFACKMAGSKLILVLGHTHCGAIQGACSGARLGNLTGLLDKIKPAIENIQKLQCEIAEEDFPDLVAEENVRVAMQKISESSPILEELLQQGKIGLAGGMYDIETGKVKFFKPLSEANTPETQPA